MKLSIITINYNNSDGLEKTIQSVLAVLNPNIEYIVIDGGSSDSSKNIIAEYSEDINKWISEADKGVYNAMNKGIEMASGEYLFFLNSGDIISDSIAFGNILNQFNDKDIVYCNLNINEPNDTRSFIKIYPRKLDYRYFFEDSLPHMASFVKKELLVKYGLYNESYKIISDWSFFLDIIILDNASYEYIDTHFSTFYTDGLSSVPENRESWWKERETHIKNSHPLIYSLYLDWKIKKEELYNLKYSKSVKLLKQLGFLKWLKY